MDRLCVVLLLVLLLTIRCCEDHHVCLRRRLIDTRFAPNISDIRVGSAPALAVQIEPASSSWGCGFEELARQVIVKLGGGRGAAVRDNLRKLGCAIVHYLPRRSWIVFLPQGLEIDRVRQIDGVTWIGEYEPSYKVAPEWQRFFENGFDEDSLLLDDRGRVVATVMAAARAVSKRCPEVDILEVLIQHWNKSLNEGGDGHVELTKLEDEAVQAAVPIDRVEGCVNWLAKQVWVTWISPTFKGQLGNMVSSSIQQSGVAASLEKGAPFSPSRPLWGMGIMGDGQIVGVGDSGVDLLSCYFRDEQVFPPGPTHRKVLSYRVMWGGDMIDSYGHGSHVAGSLLGQCDQSVGDYTVQSSKYNGMAPHAKLVFTDIGVGKNTYVTPPMDLSSYYWEAYSLGARVHSDSWTTVDRSYNLMSRSVDSFTYNNPTFLPIFAAGNAGSTLTSVGTITSPGMSKNCLTVGASMGPGHAVHHENLTRLRFHFLNGSMHVGVMEHPFGVKFPDSWGPFPVVRAMPGEACISLTNTVGMVVLASREGCSCFDKAVAIQDAGGRAAIFFNNENTGYFPIASQSSSEKISIPGGSVPKVVGDYLHFVLSENNSVFVEVVGRIPFGGDRIDSMLGFSSWGPTLDGRLKPDVVAPGEKIISAKSNMGSEAATCKNTAMSGTSMATPITAGGAALIRQYFMDGFYPTGSRVLAHSREPSGALVKAILVNGAMPLEGLNGIGVVIDPPPSNNQGYGRVDLLHSLFLPGHNTLRLTVAEDGPLKTGFGRRYCFSCLQTTEQLKFTLAWYDPPALPASSVILVNDLDLLVIDPNNQKWFGNGGPQADRLNNVEQVAVLDPKAGRYVAEVYGYYIPEEGVDGSGQRFAFVASGSFDETPCLTVSPTRVPPALGNNANVRITMEGTTGPRITWFCRLNSSVATPKAHDWHICGNTFMAEEIPDAYYTFSVQARDESFLNMAYSSTSSVDFAIDTIAPRTFIVSSSASVFCEFAVYEFSSDAIDIDRFECQLTTGNISSDAWTLCVSPIEVEAPTDGNYTFYVRGVDKAGNQDPQPAYFNWLLHRERPRARIVNILPKNIINSRTCHIYFELDVPNLPGVQEPKWSCRLELSDIGSTVNFFAWKPCSSPLQLSDLPVDNYVFSVRATENESQSGLSSVPASCTFTIDLLPPEVILFAAPPQFSSSRDAVYAFGTSEISITVCSLTKQSTKEEESWQQCASPIKFSALEDGIYQFGVKATDLAGNTGTVIKHIFLVDTTPPRIVSLALSESELNAVRTDFVVDDGPPESTSGVFTSYCRLISQVQNGSWIPCSSPWKVKRSLLAPGVKHVFMVKAEDRASNVAVDHAELKLATSNLTAIAGLVCPDAYTHLQAAVFLFNSSLSSTTKCEVDGQSPVTCESPYRVGPLSDGPHSFIVRYSTSSWSSCKWYIDTKEPATSIQSNVINTLSPSFELSGHDNHGIQRYECMLRSLDAQGQTDPWKECRQRVTYSLLPASLYIFQARTIDIAGNMDSSPAQVTFIVSYALVYYSAFSPDMMVPTNPNYCSCQLPADCLCPVSHNGTVASTHDGAIIATFPGSLHRRQYRLSSRPYESAAVSHKHLNIGIAAKLCLPVSNVSLLSSTSDEALRSAVVFMLRKTNNTLPFPLLISTKNTTLYSEGFRLIYTRDMPIYVTTVWKVVDVRLYDDERYVTMLLREIGSYMLVRIYEQTSTVIFETSMTTNTKCSWMMLLFIFTTSVLLN